MRALTASDLADIITMPARVCANMIQVCHRAGVTSLTPEGDVALILLRAGFTAREYAQHADTIEKHFIEYAREQAGRAA